MRKGYIPNSPGVRCENRLAFVTVRSVPEADGSGQGYPNRGGSEIVM